MVCQSDWEFLKKFNCCESGDHHGNLAQVANLYPDRRAGNSLHTEKTCLCFEQVSEDGGAFWFLIGEGL
jgi:hypothetical protein